VLHTGLSVEGRFLKSVECNCGYNLNFSVIRGKKVG
jgi:hypothetical protein